MTGSGARGRVSPLLSDGTALAVVGASGGCGATTLAAAVGAAAGRAGLACIAVDLQLAGGGLDVPYAVEHRPGLRWGDLLEVDGPIDGSALAARLPAAGPVRVLAHSRDAGPVPAAQAQGEVVDGLRASASLLVADVPRGLPEALLTKFDAAVVVAGDGVLELSALAATARRVSAVVAHTVLVLRGGRRSGALAAELGHRLAVPVAGWLRDDPRVARNLTRGKGPAADGPVARLADDLLSVPSPQRLSS